MEALEKEIQEIIGSSETDESLDEVYKTKDEVKAEVGEILDGMKRDELVAAADKLSPKEEAQEVQENEDEDSEWDESKLKEAYDDIKDSGDDEEEVDETDDSEEDEAAIKAVSEAMKKVLKKSSTKVESAKLKKASRKFYSENKKSVAKIVNGKNKVTKTEIKNSFDPQLSREEINTHIDTLLSGENLSEDFRTKASTIFETAVNSKVDTIVENLKEQFDTQLDQVTTQVESDLSDKIDTYLNYVVESWLEENKLAVEKGLRTELTEDFIGGLKTLFEQHYIDVPETKVDIFDDLSERVEELEEKLNSEIDKNIQLVEKLNQVNKKEIVAEKAEGLSDVQVEKLTELSEAIEYTSVEEFTQKVTTLKESYFPQQKKESKKDDAPEYTGTGSSVMDRYAQAISRTVNQ